MLKQVKYPKLNVTHSQPDSNLFDEVQVFFKNVSETFDILLPKSLTDAKKHNFQNKVVKELEQCSNTVSLNCVIFLALFTYN